MTILKNRRMPPGIALFIFFIITFAYSWTFWIMATVLARGDADQVDRMLIYAGIPGPFISACLLLYLAGSRTERLGFWQRIYEVERLRPGWLVLVLLIYPLLTAFAVAVDWLIDGSLPNYMKLSQLLHSPMLLLASIGLVFLLGPLLEEPGWRGYALDRLLSLGNFFTASLVLGILWALWHLPLFFVPGSYHHGLGFGTLAFWLFNLTAISSSVFITWIYVHNERSTFAAILFHAILNSTRDFVPLSDQTEIIRTGTLTMLAVIIIYNFSIKDLKSSH